MKNILILLALISLTSCVTKQKKESNKTAKPVIDTVQYKLKGFNNGIKLELYGNKHFKYHFYSFGCTGGGIREVVTGTYKKIEKQKKLLLFPDTVNIYNYPLEYRFQKKIKPEIFPYYAGDYRIKTEYDLVRWGGKEYLLSPLGHASYMAYDFNDTSSLFFYKEFFKNDYYEFASAYNNDLRSTRYLRCLSRKIEEPTDSTYAGLSKAVGKWQFLFLEKPILAKVIKKRRIKTKIYDVDSTFETYFEYDLTLNKGLKDKVYIGLKFFNPNTYEYAVVTKVNRNTCVAHSDFMFKPKVKILTTNPEAE